MNRNAMNSSARGNRVLIAVLVMQSMLLAGQWLGVPHLSSADAQFADPGKDRQQTIDELRSVNAKLDKLVDILGSGDLQVRVVQSDESKANAPAR